MPKQPVLLVIIHGVQYGQMSEGYATDFVDRLRKKLPDDNEIYIRPINWSRYIEGRQRQTFERLCANHRFWLKPILRLMAFLLTDTWWYLLNPMNTDKSELEERIESLVRHEIEVFKKDHPDGIVTLGGHSWGSQCALKLCYDSSLDIHGLFTWGTVCYYLSGAYQDWGKPPDIKFWINFFNPADPVSTMMTENDSFKSFVTVVTVNSWRMTPILAHTSFWKSDKMISTIAKKLLKIA